MKKPAQILKTSSSAKDDSLPKLNSERTDNIIETGKQIPRPRQSNPPKDKIATNSVTSA